MEESQIQKFYKGTNVFLTGGTGFMGKIVIEKLLRDTDVETIFVLIRDKKGITANMRIDTLLDDEIFDRVKHERPKYRHKVEPIAGDCSMLDLGISISDREKLISKIDIVLHVAATVNFTEQIKLSYTINVNGTKYLLNLAREMKKLKSLIHVSTAYANCNRKDIDEKIYDISIKYSDVEAVLNKISVEESDFYTPKILGEWPNTYTFTKALAESVIKDMGNGLPIGIFRPAIIVSTYKEPIPGWIDNLYGATGIVAGTMTGVLRVSLTDEEKVAEIVPIDTCVAGLLAAAWDVAEKTESSRKPGNIPVYNYVSSCEHAIYWKEFSELALSELYKYSSFNAIWCPLSYMISNVYLYAVVRILVHILPAAVLDLLSVVKFKKPRLISLYKKMHKFSEAIGYFATQEWTFSNKNTQNLYKKMNKTDQELFPMSMAKVSWFLFFHEYVRGVRKYMLKEPESTLELSRAKCRRFKIMHLILVFILLGITFNLFTSVLFKMFSLSFGYITQCANIFSLQSM